MTDPISLQLSRLLRTALVEDNVSQAELSRRTGLTAKHINQMVTGKSGATAMYDYCAFCLGRRWVLTLEIEDEL